MACENSCGTAHVHRMPAMGTSNNAVPCVEALCTSRAERAGDWLLHSLHLFGADALQIIKGSMRNLDVLWEEINCRNSRQYLHINFGIEYVQAQWHSAVWANLQHLEQDLQVLLRSKDCPLAAPG